MTTLSTPVIIAIASIAIVAIVFVVVKMKPVPTECPTCPVCATAPPCPTCPTAAPCPTCAACPTAPPCPTCAACPTCPPVPLMGTWDIMIPDRDTKIPMKLSIKPGPSLLTISTDDPNRRGQPPSEITKRLPADGGGELIYAAEPNRGNGRDRPVVLFRNGKIYMIVEGVILSPGSSNTNPSEYIGDWLLQRDSTILGTFTIKRIENGDYVLSAENRDMMTYTKKADGALIPKTPDPRIGNAEFIYDKTLNKAMLVVPVN